MGKLEKELTIKNPQGLHARPAALFVQTASQFDSFVRIRKNNEVVDGKSIMAILSLGLEKGSKIVLIVEGDDAEEALRELEKILLKDE